MSSSTRSWIRSPRCSPPPTARSSPAGSTTRASRSWLGRRDRRAAVAERRLAVQARGRDPRALDAGRGGDPASHRPAARPVLLGDEAHLAAGGGARGRRRTRAGRCGSARSTRSLMRPARRGSATDPSTASRTQLQRLGGPAGTRASASCSASRGTRCPRCADTVGDARRASPRALAASAPAPARLVDQQAALAGTGCVERRHEQGHLRDRRLRARARRRRCAGAGGGLLPTVAWTDRRPTEYALDGGVFTAGALLEWLSRELGLAADPPRCGACAHGRGLGRCAGAARAGGARGALVACRRRAP